jgi:hypothetical protein
VDKLLEMILLQADLLELEGQSRPPRQGQRHRIRPRTGRPHRHRAGAQRDVAVGDVVICGPYWGKVRALISEEGTRQKEAGPSVAVKILGLNGVPEAGLEFSVLEDEKAARDLAEQRAEKPAISPPRRAPKSPWKIFLPRWTPRRPKCSRSWSRPTPKARSKPLWRRSRKSRPTQVSLEVIHSAVGTITESDVLLASASSAIILGFHTRIDVGVADLAKREGVQIKLYSIIYELIDQVKEAMAGLLEPVIKEVVIGSAEVRKIFELSKGGNVAGCMVTSGRIVRGKARVLRRKGLIYEGVVQTLRRFQDEVNEVRAGMECGIRIEGFNDMQPGDLIECFTTEKVAPKLPDAEYGAHVAQTATGRELLKREIGEVIRRQLPVNEVGLINVNDVDVAPNLHNATVYIGVLGGEAQKKKGHGSAGTEPQAHPGLSGQGGRAQVHAAASFCARRIGRTRQRILRILDELEKSSPPHEIASQNHRPHPRNHRQSQTICVAGHVRPDGDCIGSQVGLSLALAQAGQGSGPAGTKTRVPQKYAFLDPDHLLQKPCGAEFDLLICTDCASFERLGKVGPPWPSENASSTSTITKQHPLRRLNWISAREASTGELIFRLLQAPRWPITPAIADCLFTAVSTDTGSFQYSTTKPVTYPHAGELVKLGAHVETICHEVYQSFSLSRVRLLKHRLQSFPFDAPRPDRLPVAQEKGFCPHRRRPQRYRGADRPHPRHRTGGGGRVFEEVEPELTRISLRSKSARIDVNQIAANSAEAATRRRRRAHPRQAAFRPAPRHRRRQESPRFRPLNHARI